MSSEKAKDLLINRSKQIMASADLIAQETNDWQVIQAYMTRRLNDMELTPVQQEKLNRYQFIYNQLVTGKYTEVEVKEMVMSTYHLSASQALADIRDSKEIFSSSVNINRLFELKVELELNKQYIQRCMAASDFRAAANFEKVRAKLLEMLPEAEETPTEHFEPRTNVFVFDPTLLGHAKLRKTDVDQLLKDIETKYPGKLDLHLGEFEDAVIVEE